MIYMTFAECLSWLNSTIITPFFNFSLPFWGGVTFGAVVVAIFGLPLIVKLYRKLF